MPKLLTNKRQAWAATRAQAPVFKGKVLRPNVAPADRYSRAVKRLIEQMGAEYRKELVKLWKQDHAQQFFAMDAGIGSQARILLNKLQKRFQALFNRTAPTIVEGLVGGIDKASSSDLHQSLKELSGGLSLGTTAITADLSQQIKAATAENVGLIKSIAQQYHERVAGAVYRSVSQGYDGGTDYLLGELNRFEGLSKQRAEFIAVDQTRKITTAMNDARMRKAGIRKFEWIHSGGGAEPRKLHKELDGKVFSLDDPPIIDERTGERGLPGQLINCRCTMRPILDFGDDDDD